MLAYLHLAIAIGCYFLATFMPRDNSGQILNSLICEIMS